MNKTKISWCNATWNPAHGCLQDPPCPYCYARKMARRFGDKDFKPTWKQKNFDKPFPKKPSRIFVNSMSDISCWEDEWIELVLNKIREFPQHTYLFLTKQPKCYVKFGDAPYNCWFGITITDQNAMLRFENLFFSKHNQRRIGVNRKLFFSIEPLLTDIKINVFPDWLIIGAETGNRKDRVIPRYSWVENIALDAIGMGIPVFLKENLADVWKRELIQEYPV